MHLFIDTNIFLSFYHLTNDDLEELKKLTVLVEQKSVTLYVTDQVVAEFTRNRESKIDVAVKKLKEQHLNLQFPQVCKDYPEYQELRKLQKQYEEAHSELLTKLKADVAAQKLKADLVIAELFEVATTVETTSQLVDQARLRIDIGNPPGKNGSLGDAINWEILLLKVPKGSQLFFVSEDQDYASKLDKTKFKDFLQQEWQKYKASDVVYYEHLSSFFKEEFPTIKLASELEKDLLINQLYNSPSFANTHTLIAKISKYSEFTSAQASAILSAALANNQVEWIMKDADVQKFMESILTGYESKIDPAVVSEVKTLLGPSATDTEHDDDFAI